MAEDILNSYIDLYIPKIEDEIIEDVIIDDEINSGSPPETIYELIENLNQLFDSDPAAALTYLLDNFAVLFKFWWSIPWLL